MASEIDVAVKEKSPLVESKTLEEQASALKFPASTAADVLSKKGLTTAVSVNQAMKELSQKTDGLKVRPKYMLRHAHGKPRIYDLLSIYEISL